MYARQHTDDYLGRRHRRASFASRNEVLRFRFFDFIT
jgi:hypothetical protein